MNPSKKSKYKLNTVGIKTGTIILIISIITKAPMTLPNKRMHKDKGRVNTSRILIGVTTATGCVKLFIQPFIPFARIPLISIKIILISANAIVTFISLVGGFIPKMPMMFARPIYNRMVEMYVLYSLAFSPSMEIVNLSNHNTMLSATICFLLGL